MGGPGRVQGFRAGYGVVCACVAVVGVCGEKTGQVTG